MKFVEKRSIEIPDDAVDLIVRRVSKIVADAFYVHNTRVEMRKTLDGESDREVKVERLVAQIMADLKHEEEQGAN